MRLIQPIGVFVVLFVVGVSSISCQKNSNRASPTPTPQIMPAHKMPTPTNDAERLLLREYGAMFAAKGVMLPKKIFFRDEADVAAFQKAAGEKTELFDGVDYTLQPLALDALKKAVEEAAALGLSITPRDYDAAKRSYAETVDLWVSRVDPALDHWVANGRVKPEEAEEIRKLTPYDQVIKILDLEKKGVYFAKDLSKSIIYSVAPPGSSQHLAMLAFDINEHSDARIRAILGRHGWFQTVVSDLPHFTYLGAREVELRSLGLKKVTDSGRKFWVPVMR